MVLVLAALYPRLRDLKPIWEVALQILFYGSPILYALEVIPDEDIQRGILVNPLAALLQQTRHWLIDPSAPSAAEAIGGGERLLLPIGIALAVMALGAWMFAREAPRIAEEL
jgi:ABC-2 type transport system permease protein